MLLGRLQADCEYFLGFGYGSVKRLYYGNIPEHIEGMKKLWHSFPESGKPEWLTLKQIEEYEQKMLAYKN